MDAVVSAIAYAELKKALGETKVTPARCGGTNERIDLVLGKFGFPAPVFVSDVRPRVEDVMVREVVFARVDEPVYNAVGRIGENHYRGLPVLDADNRCLGLISSFKITNYLFPPRGEEERAREVEASLTDICETIGGRSLAGKLPQEPHKHILVVAAMQTDSFAARLKQMDLERTVLIVGDRSNIHHVAVEAGVRALIVTGGLSAEASLIKAAGKKGISVISSPHDTATTVLLARSAVQAGKLLHPEIRHLRADLPLEQAKRMVALSSQFVFPVLDAEGCLEGILSKSDFLKPVPRRLILVDHNELSQAVEGAEEVPIVEILDHHRIGAVHTETPILFLNQPLGSTSTIVALQYRQAGIDIPQPVAGILMAGLISDTLNLTSPTTTPVDREVMTALSEITGIRPEDLAAEIFSVGSPLLTMPPDKAIVADCKEYEEKGVRFSIAQIEELNFSCLRERTGALLEALEAYRAQSDYYFAALLVTDVNTQHSILLACGPKEFLSLIEYPEWEPGTWRLDEVVSRKKQLLPYLSGLLDHFSSK